MAEIGRKDDSWRSLAFAQSAHQRGMRRKPNRQTKLCLVYNPFIAARLPNQISGERVDLLVQIGQVSPPRETGRRRSDRATASGAGRRVQATVKQPSASASVTAMTLGQHFLLR